MMSAFLNIVAAVGTLMVGLYIGLIQHDWPRGSYWLLLTVASVQCFAWQERE